MAVYATSNRRNLVKQNFSDRNGDEVDNKETIQEKTSLAERFGLRIPYTALNRNQFLDMVEELAAVKGIECDREVLRAEAVKWEMRHPNRTPRVALQFLASLQNKHKRQNGPVEFSTGPFWSFICICYFEAPFSPSRSFFAHVPMR